MNEEEQPPPSPLSEPALVELTATAYHEAGHAVMAMAVGRPIKKVTIRPGNSRIGQPRLGVCEIDRGRTKPSKNGLDDEVLILFAGMVAEARFTGQYCRLGAGQDLRAISRLLQNRAGTERQLERLQKRLLDKTEHVLDDAGHVRAIELIAQALIENQSISGRAVRHLFNQAAER
jgi:hypothetical protein